MRVIPSFRHTDFDSGYWHWQPTTTMKRCRQSSDSDVRSVDRFREVAHAVSFSLYYELLFFAAYPATVHCCNVFVRVAFSGGGSGMVYGQWKIGGDSAARAWENVLFSHREWCQVSSVRRTPSMVSGAIDVNGDRTNSQTRLMSNLMNVMTITLFTYTRVDDVRSG